MNLVRENILNLVSNLGFLKSDGVYGPFIVREAMEKWFYPDLYDVDVITEPLLV